METLVARIVRLFISYEFYLRQNSNIMLELYVARTELFNIIIVRSLFSIHDRLEISSEQT
jgi:hypothetical protein